jgi:hypothetical protein
VGVAVHVPVGEAVRALVETGVVDVVGEAVNVDVMVIEVVTVGVEVPETEGVALVGVKVAVSATAGVVGLSFFLQAKGNVKIIPKSIANATPLNFLKLISNSPTPNGLNNLFGGLCASWTRKGIGRTLSLC